MDSKPSAGSGTSNISFHSMWNFIFNAIIINEKKSTRERINHIYISDLSLLEIRSHCLSLQCGNDPRFIDTPCVKSLIPICLYTLNSVEGKFKTSHTLHWLLLKSLTPYTDAYLKSIFTRQYKTTRESKYLCFRFKILHRLNPTIPMWQNIYNR